jgi:hypothetical protein
LAANEGDARSAITGAEQRVSTCYSAGAEAQKAGANVTLLLLTLDDAGMLLSRAHLHFEKGNFDDAQVLAVQCKTILQGFESEASSLRDTAANARSLDFMINVAGSAVGAIVVVVAGFAVWQRLKKKHTTEARGI